MREKFENIYKFYMEIYNMASEFVREDFEFVFSTKIVYFLKLYYLKAFLDKNRGLFLKCFQEY